MVSVGSKKRQLNMVANLQSRADLSLIALDPTDFSNPNHHAFYYLYNHPANNTWVYYVTRTEKAFEAVYKTFFTQKDAIYLLQEQNGDIKKIIGTCAAQRLRPPRQHVLEITAVTIDPDLHGKNYGKKLFALLHERLKIDFPEAFRYELSYGLNNPIANIHRFYTKNGYEDEAIWHDFFRLGVANYAEHDNPYESWLNANSGDLRRLKNCWYADEIVAAHFTQPIETITNYQPSKQAWLSDISRPLTGQNNDYIVREAQECELDECVNLYFLSDTEWGFLDRAALKEIVSNAIRQKQLWIIKNQHEALGACHVLLAQHALEHAGLLKHTVVQNHNVAASGFLFQNILSAIKNNHPTIKRLEINISDDAQHLALGLYANNFQYTGTLRCRLQTYKQKFLDEHVFEKRLFNLEDAITLCKNRLESELFYEQNPQIPNPFNMPLKPDFLRHILQNLEKLQTTDELYNIIKTICTQDMLPTATRLNAIQQLETLLNA